MQWRAALSCAVVLVGCGGSERGDAAGTGGYGTAGTDQPTGAAAGATQAGGGQVNKAGAAGQEAPASGGALGSAGAGSGGARAGGTGGTGGTGPSSGGVGPTSGAGARSVPDECFRPYICVDTCGGEEQNFGCRACPDDMVDTIYCPDEGSTTGLFGAVNFLEGNHQPTSGIPSGKTTPVAREVRFYPLVTSASVQRASGDDAFKAGLYSAILGNLQAKAYSGDDGKYQVTLKPGKYSAFVEDGDSWYCNLQAGDGLCVVEVPASAAIKYDIDITYAASF